MQTDYLTELGITKEQIQAIMAENGKDIEREKAKLVPLQNKIAAYEAKLSKLDGVDIEGLQTEITNLKGEIAAIDEKQKKEKADAETAGIINTFYAAHKSCNRARSAQLTIFAAVDIFRRVHRDRRVCVYMENQNENTFSFPVTSSPAKVQCGEQEFVVLIEFHTLEYRKRHGEKALKTLSKTMQFRSIAVKKYIEKPCSIGGLALLQGYEVGGR